MLQELEKDILKIYQEHKNITDKVTKHNRIQKNLIQLSTKYGYTAVKEVDTEYYYPYYPFTKRKGRLDIMWYKDKSSIAFELDSSLRLKSLCKLLTCKGAKIWIYFGDSTKELNEFLASNENISKHVYTIAVKNL